MEPKIAVKGVTHAFGDREVLEGVSFEVSSHELVCIVGPSGGGKTTLLRIMAGLLRPSGGRVSIDGEPVTGPSPRMAMVFQHFGLFPWKSVRANIAYGLRNRGRYDARRVDEMVGLIGLTDAADRYPYQLSGGMQQRVGLARALAVDPEVLLMDEPFGALDAMTREQLQEELLRLWERDQGKTGVFITHDIDDAILLGDRGLVLLPKPGRLGATMEIPIPRPRSPRSVRAHPDYPALRESIWSALGPGMEPAGR